MFGTTAAGTLSLDLDKLVGGHVGILGNTGSGKSFTLRKLLELAHGTFQQVVFDVEEEFHTLADVAAYQVVRASAHDPRSLLRRIMGSRASIVIQMNDLKVEEQGQFIADFIRALMALERSYWRPMLIVVDEAHRYAPQGSGIPSLPAINELLARGRKRGFTAVLATQRLAKISKNAVAEVTNWIIGRTGPIDRRRASDVLGFKPTSQEGAGLPHLDPGEFWCFGPALDRTAVLAKISLPQSRHLTLKEFQRQAPARRVYVPQGLIVLVFLGLFAGAVLWLAMTVHWMLTVGAVLLALKPMQVIFETMSPRET